MHDERPSGATSGEGDPVLIRSASLSDAPDIARLATELGYPTGPEEMTKRLRPLLRSTSYFLAIAEQSHTVVGWVAAERRLLLESGERAEIVGLIVTTRVRRAGIGQALVESAEEWALRQGLRIISVRSNVTRAESHPFYERLGYKRTKTQHAYSKELAHA